MPVNNAMYDQMNWWNDDSSVSLLSTSINPCRISYFHDVLSSRIGLQPSKVRVLDVGCGGGLLAEEFSKKGWKVTGVDQSAPSIELAKAHAAKVGLSIDYQVSRGQKLPFEDETFDVVYCCDVLEHIPDYPTVVAESSRVLKKGGVYLYETINRTLMSNLIAIKLLQEWSWTRVIPDDVHDWKMFIRPEELHGAMRAAKIQNVETRGMTVDNPIGFIKAILRHRRGQTSLGEVGRIAPAVVSDDMSMGYMGFGIKSA
ncbi:3-demethylubiquinone-9 3-O-methyltransferase [Archangium minus]|uniref:3-demethylubiquinone-9 3-O-methyltransferase n=1 Tax=Archangium minus TaxID=83450 RepID=A0ABY9WTN1_9BACT|nr:3-demethylubiquinone-9 3-O-methyltransferase [Archangium minus]